MKISSSLYAAALTLFFGYFFKDVTIPILYYVILTHADKWLGDK